ncbi:hypothetical protein [Rheinheimera sp.]|uniref:hypothetical protein n=1 Tax=Rheinheimera sp. TaxID=1869214 RepID=UPI004048824F
MRKYFIAMVAALSVLLAGCGQNVETIKSEFAKETGEVAEYDFSGYAFIIKSEEEKKARDFHRENSLPRYIDLTADYALKELPKISFKNDTFKNIEQIRGKITDRIAEIRALSQAETEKRTREFKEKIEGFERNIADINATMATYKSLFSEELAVYEAAVNDGKTIEQQQQAREALFQDQIKQAVISNGLAIDVSKPIRPAKYYSHKKQSQCKGLDESKIKYLDDKANGCFMVTLSPANKVLTPLFLEFANDSANLYMASQQSREIQTEKYNALSKAKIVAKNQTGIDEHKVDRQIHQLEKQIAQQNKLLKENTNERGIFASMLNTDKGYDALKSDYKSTVIAFHKDLRIEAFRRAGVDVNTINDETDSPSSEPSDSGILLFVFTNKDNEQYVYVAPMTHGGKKEYLSFFKYSKQQKKFEFPIKDKDSAMRAAEEIL